VDDLDVAERFYGDVLGLTKISSVPGRMLAFRCQESVLLLFDPQSTQRERVVVNGGAIPLHGAPAPVIWRFGWPRVSWKPYANISVLLQ